MREAMVFRWQEVRLHYQMGSEPMQPINRDPFDLFFVYEKVNLSREHFGILNHHDDVDRRATVEVRIDKPLIVDGHKIMFVTFLQLFYQNIKHRDGLAGIF